MSTPAPPPAGATGAARTGPVRVVEGKSGNAVLHVWKEPLVAAVAFKLEPLQFVPDVHELHRPRG